MRSSVITGAHNHTTHVRILLTCCCVCVSEYRSIYLYLNILILLLFPLLLQIEQAIECLVDIATHGEAAAAKYTEEAPNEECKKMAEAFFMQG